MHTYVHNIQYVTIPDTLVVNMAAPDVTLPSVLTT